MSINPYESPGGFETLAANQVTPPRWSLGMHLLMWVLWPYAIFFAICMPPAMVFNAFMEYGWTPFSQQMLGAVIGTVVAAFFAVAMWRAGWRGDVRWSAITAGGFAAVSGFFFLGAPLLLVCGSLGNRELTEMALLFAVDGVLAAASASAFFGWRRRLLAWAARQAGDALPIQAIAFPAS